VGIVVYWVDFASVGGSDHSWPWLMSTGMVIASRWTPSKGAGHVYPREQAMRCASNPVSPRHANWVLVSVPVLLERQNGVSLEKRGSVVEPEAPMVV
jgi:hypothetical protein